MAKNDTFQGLVKAITAVAAKTGTDVEAIKAAAYPGGGTVATPSPTPSPPSART